MGYCRRSFMIKHSNRQTARASAKRMADRNFGAPAESILRRRNSGGFERIRLLISPLFLLAQIPDIG